MVICYGPEGSKTVNLTSKGGEHSFGTALPVVGIGTGVASGVDVVFFL